jgi:hypothetical protein
MTDWQEINSNSSGYTIGLMQNNGNAAVSQRLIVGTALTGLVRGEWVQARFGQVIPTNWSWVQMWQFMAPGSFMPVGYQVDDAQNLICAQAIQGDYEWLLLYEHDMLPRPDALVRLAEYMKRKDTPVISGLYFTRSIPSEPLIYRGRGTLAFEDFDIGDFVCADGVPTGFLLVHMSIIRAMWEESEAYMIGDSPARRVFETPARAWYDPESEEFNTQSGTSDLAWCERIMNEGFFTKAGWPEYQDKEYPFLVDTNIGCMHINNTFAGEQFPPGGIHEYWRKVRESRGQMEPEPAPLGVSVADGVGIGEKVG